MWGWEYGVAKAKLGDAAGNNSRPTHIHPAPLPPSPNHPSTQHQPTHPPTPLSTTHPPSTNHPPTHTPPTSVYDGEADVTQHPGLGHLRVRQQLLRGQGEEGRG